MDYQNEICWAYTHCEHINKSATKYPNDDNGGSKMNEKKKYSHATLKKRLCGRKKTQTNEGER